MSLFLVPMTPCEEKFGYNDPLEGKMSEVDKGAFFCENE